MYLKELTSLSCVSGNETEVREFIQHKIYDYCDEMASDSIGNLICLIKGDGTSDKKVMLCAHMDEVGFIVSGIDGDGFIRFKSVGGIDTRVLISKKVCIGANKVCGVIGAKAIHLQKKSEREQVPEEESLYIDIGAKDKEDAQNYVSVGDYCAFDSDYVEFGDGFIKAKALDDRIGCDILLELAREKKRYPFDLYLVFTAQEEVGTRGAKVCANRICPDVAIVLEATTCSDVYGTEEKDFSTKAGEGAALSFIDRGAYYDKKLLKTLLSLAKKRGIRVQLKQTATGGNDANAIHTAAGGVKTAAISVPARYIHSSASVVNKKDISAMKELLFAFLEEGMKE